MVIALPFVTLVRELALLVDAKGYTPLDAPVLSICVAHTLVGVENFLSTEIQSMSQEDSAYSVGEWVVDMEGNP